MNQFRFLPEPLFFRHRQICCRWPGLGLPQFSCLRLLSPNPASMCSAWRNGVFTETSNYWLVPAGAFVSMVGKLLVAGALVIPADALPASLALELVDCMPVELSGVF